MTMQPSAILQQAFPIHAHSHCLRYTVDPHPVSDRAKAYDGWIIRAHFSSWYNPTPLVVYARIDRGCVAFSAAANVIPRPFHHGPGNPSWYYAEWSRQAITEADWRHFADHAPHYAEQPVDELRRICERERGKPHRWVTGPERRLVGWFPVVDYAGNLTGEVIEGSHEVSWYRLDSQLHCVVLEPHGDQRDRLEVEQLQAILGAGGTVRRGSDSIEMSLGGITRWGHNPRHAVEVAEGLRRMHGAAQETAQETAQT